MVGAAFGAAAPFWVNAFSNVGSIAALFGMRHSATRTHGLPAERLAGAIRAGMRHARGNLPLRATLRRAALLFFLATASMSARSITVGPSPLRSTPTTPVLPMPVATS
jgi:hypothetical protein